jgi:hypothetical protein
MHWAAERLSVDEDWEPFKEERRSKEGSSSQAWTHFESTVDDD